MKKKRKNISNKSKEGNVWKPLLEFSSNVCLLYFLHINCDLSPLWRFMFGIRVCVIVAYKVKVPRIECARYELIEWSNESWIELALNNHIDLICHLKINGQKKQPCEIRASFIRSCHSLTFTRWKLSELDNRHPGDENFSAYKTPVTKTHCTQKHYCNQQSNGIQRTCACIPLSLLIQSGFDLESEKSSLKWRMHNFFVSICHSYFPNASLA